VNAALRLTLAVLPGRLAICGLAARAAVPAWASEGALTSITRTPRELSVVCEERLVPAGVRAERGYVALEVAGPLPLGMVGVGAALTGPLADAGISLFAVSTYDTDYVLVKAESLDAALRALSAAGHAVTPPGVVRVD